MNKTIGILGCGWLGTSLAKDLMKSSFSVKGTTTSPEKRARLLEAGINVFQVTLHETTISGDIGGFLKNLDILIINVPPNLRKNPSSDYVGKMNRLTHHIIRENIKYVLFISSTSVYGDVSGEITESTVAKPLTESGRQLLRSERLFLDETSFNTTIIRFGGLIGDDRHPITMLSGKVLDNGEELVNLIHKKDCIHMIKTIIVEEYWNEIFNGVYPYHPKKSEYYLQEAKKRGLPPPTYRNSAIGVSKKRIVFKNFYVKNHNLTTSICS